MKSFRNHLAEAAAIKWRGSFNTTNTRSGSDTIAVLKQDAKKRKTKYHRIANIGDFAVWGTVIKSEHGGRSWRGLRLDIIHRPTNKTAGRADMVEVVRGKKRYWKVDTVDVNKEFRKDAVGHSVAKDLYAKLNELGQSIESGSQQTKGGQSIWRRLLQDPKTRKRAQFVSGDAPGGGLRKWKSGDARRVWGKRAPEYTAVALPGKKKFGLPAETKTQKHAKSLYKPGTAWKTPGNKWGAKNRKGEVEYFDDDRTAQKWAKR